MRSPISSRLFPPDAVWIVLVAVLILVAATANAHEVTGNTGTSVNSNVDRRASVERLPGRSE